MLLLDTFRIGLLKFNQSLVKLPSLKKERREIKELRKKYAIIKYSVETGMQVARFLDGIIVFLIFPYKL